MPMTGDFGQENLLIGNKVREMRRHKGWSQSDLARVIGVTCQMVHKYEHGRNSISAVRLKHIAAAFGAPVSDFYENTETIVEPPLQREIIELNKSYMAIPKRRQRDGLRAMARSLAEEGPA